MDGWGIGRKMGNMVYYLNFPHFGQADIGTYMCLGGMIFIILLVWSCYMFFCRNYKQFLIRVSLILSLVAEGIYTQVFTGNTTILAMMFLYLLLWVIYRDSVKETVPISALSDRHIGTYTVSYRKRKAQ